MRRQKMRAVWWLAPLAWVIGQAGVQAAETAGRASSESQLEEIVVIAQRREENLQDVPIAITALTSSELARAGVDGFQNLQVAVPSLSFAQIAGFALPRIRGVGTNAFGPGLENSVAVYIDDVYIVSPFAQMLAFNNVAQTAVLRGPQGTLFGRNATGGVIQVTTIEPGGGPRFDGSLTAGNESGAQLYAEAPLGSQANLGVAGFYDSLRSYGRNATTGRDLRDGRQVGARAKLRWQPTDTTVVRLGVDYSESDGDFFALRIADGTLPIGGTRYTGREFDTNVNTDTIQRIEAEGASLQIEQELGAMSLVSITAYREALIDEAFDSDAQPQPITRVDVKATDRQFSQELRLLSAKNDRLTWLLGAYFLDATGRYPFQDITSRAPPFLAPPTRIHNEATQTTRSWSGFGQVNLGLTPNTQLTFGGRYTRDERQLENLRRVTLPNGVSLPATTATGEATFEKPTWRLSLDHRFSPRALAYASYNRGFKSGLFDPTSQPANLLQPEVLDAYEVGAKWDLLERRFRVNAAVFHYDYKNIQISRIVNGAVFLLNGEGAKIDGVDLDLTARITSRLEVGAGVSVLDHRFASFPNAPFTIPSPTGGNAIVPGDAAGNRLPMVPRWTANATATYTVELGRGTLELNGTYFHSDGYFDGPDNRFRQRPFDIVNASATWILGKWRASLWARNAFNQFYATQLSAQPRGDAVISGDPRRYGLTVALRVE